MQWLLILAAADPSPLAQVTGTENQLVILMTIVFFVIFYLLLQNLVFKPVLALLDEREAKILGGMKEIEQQRAAVEQLKADYDRQWATVEAAAAAKTQAAIDAGKKEVQALQEQARQEYLALIEQGKASLEAEFAAARGQLLDQATHLTFTAIERTLATGVERSTYEPEVRKRLEEVIHA